MTFAAKYVRDRNDRPSVFLSAWPSVCPTVRLSVLEIPRTCFCLANGSYTFYVCVELCGKKLLYICGICAVGCLPVWLFVACCLNLWQIVEIVR